MRETFLHLAGAHDLRMTFAAKKNVPAHPADMCLLRVNGVVLGSQGVPQLIEQICRLRAGTEFLQLRCGEA